MSSAAGMQVTPGAARSADVLRSVAHELRQPLSAIESIAYYLSLILPHEDGRVQEQLARLQQLVEQSNWILSNGLHLSDPTPVSSVPMDLEELVTQAVSARASPGDPPVQFDLAGNLPQVGLDPALGRALVANLLTLFRQLSPEAHPLRIRTCAVAEQGALLEISTAAAGCGPEDSLGPGSGLSLDSARRMVEAHGGTFAVEIDPATGIRVRVMLP